MRSTENTRRAIYPEPLVRVYLRLFFCLFKPEITTSSNVTPTEKVLWTESFARVSLRELQAFINSIKSHSILRRGLLQIVDEEPEMITSLGGIEVKLSRKNWRMFSVEHDNVQCSRRVPDWITSTNIKQLVCGLLST